jgi:hypothetical protein
MALSYSSDSVNLGSNPSSPAINKHRGFADNSRDSDRPTKAEISERNAHERRTKVGTVFGVGILHRSEAYRRRPLVDLRRAVHWHYVTRVQS